MSRGDVIMLLSRHYKTEQTSLGRILAFIGAYAAAAVIPGIIAVLLMLILANPPVTIALR